ncbi:hypothetical protein TraAM80_09664 [Trypanosoma rangeli]|uniref:Uncharacterized protein n=1 Tax=Trypanosoma rangeli TaxID=5698 RepID=A0A422MU21_TRYRA|nr:uncharacterized protein TraAM80_09664 [Trypanosoma rangeli]RNE96720.1 hypothetical protein TraAM80_09664 [Trypanosoma rangeli]|eukprot:RNE96720.1 hypothetical protein TraAM80_09664 [Trypanosoma rangeli]
MFPAAGRDARQVCVNELHHFRLSVPGLLVGTFISIMFGVGAVGAFIQERHGFSRRELIATAAVGLMMGQFLLPYDVLYVFTGPKPMLYVSVGLLFLLVCSPGNTPHCDDFLGTSDGRCH